MSRRSASAMRFQVLQHPRRLPLDHPPGEHRLDEPPQRSEVPASPGSREPGSPWSFGSPSLRASRWPRRPSSPPCRSRPCWTSSRGGSNVVIAQSLSDFMKPGPPRSRYTVPSAHLPLGHDSHLDHKGPELGVPARIGQEIPDDLSRSSDLHRAFNSRHQSSSSARKCLARRPIVPRPTSRATDRPGALTPCLQPHCSSRSRLAEPSKPRWEGWTKRGGRPGPADQHGH